MAAVNDLIPSTSTNAQINVDIDNDAGYIDPMTLKVHDDHRDEPTTATAPTTVNTTTTTGVHDRLNKLCTKPLQVTKLILIWMHKKMVCLLNLTITISAIISMILKLPFFVLLTTILLDTVKQRLKAKAKMAAATNGDDAYRPYDEEPPASGTQPSQSSRGLLVEALIFIILLVAVILIQFLVFITHLCSSRCCCRNDGSTSGHRCQCGNKGCTGGHRGSMNRCQMTRQSILLVYLPLLLLWIVVFASSYYIKEWPYFGGGIFLIFKLLIHGNSLTGTPDFWQVKLIKHCFSFEFISALALVSYFILQIIDCWKRREADHSDSNKELTGDDNERQIETPSSICSKCSSPCHGGQNDVSISDGRSSSTTKKTPINRRHEYPKASTMKWYTINCGCFTLFDPRKDQSNTCTLTKRTPRSYDDDDANSSCSRGTPSDCSSSDVEITSNGDVHVQINHEKMPLNSANQVAPSKVAATAPLASAGDEEENSKLLH